MSWRWPCFPVVFTGALPELLAGFFEALDAFFAATVTFR